MGYKYWLEISALVWFNLICFFGFVFFVMAIIGSLNIGKKTMSVLENTSDSIDEIREMATDLLGNAKKVTEVANTPAIWLFLKGVLGFGKNKKGD